MNTRTGNFPIGFRRAGSQWQKDTTALAAWAAGAGFALIDLPRPTEADADALASAGLSLVCVDLIEWAGALAADGGKRQETVAANTEYINTWAARGVKAFFLVAMPPDAEADAKQVMGYAVESFGRLGEAAVAAGGMIVFEGYPGGRPHYPALMCTPETLRHLFNETGGKGLGVNYDPSHLIRLGIDHIRFLEEFGGKIGHVHAKDTEVIDEGAYEYGLFQKALFGKKHGYGEWAWRYTLPGLGRARWTRVCELLAAAGYTGALSIELEDEHFNGSEEGEKTALKMSLTYLAAT
jgi:sugar phosphate isomerase/epimerase